MKKLIFSYLLTSLFLILSPVPEISAQDFFPTPWDVIEAVNALRASNGLPPYYVDPVLMAAAQFQADYLASGGGTGSCHVGPGGSDADQRAYDHGYPEVPGLDVNENCGSLGAGQPVEALFTGGWADELHMHTMLHERGQHAGAGVAVSGDRAYVILDVGAFWGDAGLTQQPTTSGWGDAEHPYSQFIAPVQTASPATDGSLTHIVQAGQSLYMISEQYGVSAERLMELNNLNKDSILYVGQQILIRPASTPGAEITMSPPTQTAPLPATQTVQPVRASIESPTAELDLEDTEEQGTNLTLLLAFFALFGIGLVLVVVSLSGNKAA